MESSNTHIDEEALKRENKAEQNNALLEIRDNAQLEARDNALLETRDNAQLEVRDDALLETRDNALLEVRDGRYGWIVCFAAFVNSVIVDGVVFLFGILLLELQGHFKDVSKAKFASVGSVLNGTYHIVGPLVAVLINKFGCRAVCMAGSLISTIAFCLSTLSPNVEVLLFTYSIVGGFGFGLLSMPGLMMVGYYFNKRRATATGIAVCGSSVGTLVFAPFTNYLIEMYGWRGAQVIIAGVVLQGVISGALLRPLASTISKSGVSNKDKKYVRSSFKRSSECEAEYIPNEINSNLDGNYKSRQGDLRDFEGLNDGLLLSHKNMEAAESMANNNIAVEKQTLDEHNITTLTISSKITEVMDEMFKAEVHQSVECLTEFKDKVISKEAKELLDYEVDILEQYSPENYGLAEKISVTNDETEDANGFENESVSDTDKTTERSNRSINSSKAITLLCNAMKKHLLMFGLLKYPPFLIYVISCFILNIGILLPIFFLPDFAVKQGLTSKQASLIISAVGIANVISRVLCGILSDMKWVDRLLLNNVTLIIAGGATVLCPLYDSFEALLIYAAVFGFSIAVFVSLRTIIMIDLLGIERLTNAYGILTFFQGISGIIGGPIAGALYDGSGNYNYTFYLAGVTIAVAGVMNLPLKRLANYLDKKKNMCNPVATSLNHE